MTSSLHSRIHIRVRRGLLAGALIGATMANSASPAHAQAVSLVGDWTGQWDGGYFVEYKITKATRRALTAYYGYKPQANGPTTYQLITCNAVSPTEYNCGASSLVFTSTTSVDATMHAQNGHTATASLSR